MKRSTLYYLFALAGLIITWIFNAQYLIQGGSVEPAAFFGAAMLTPLTTAITLDVYWNTTATTGAMTVLKGIVGSTSSKTVSITPEVGGPVFSGEFMCDGIKPASSVDGVIMLGSVHFSVMGATAPTWA